MPCASSILTRMVRRYCALGVALTVEDSSVVGRQGMLGSIQAQAARSCRRGSSRARAVLVEWSVKWL